jgi:hypothetical protein
VSKTRILEGKKNIEELTAKRNLLFAQLLKNPTDTHPAVEIKLLDDEIAELRVRK